MSIIDGVLDRPPPQLLDNGEGMVLSWGGQVIDVEIDDDFNHQSTIETTQAATNPM
jgi:hypothetical protein